MLQNKDQFFKIFFAPSTSSPSSVYVFSVHIIRTPFSYLTLFLKILYKPFFIPIHNLQLPVISYMSWKSWVYPPEPLVYPPEPLVYPPEPEPETDSDVTSHESHSPQKPTTPKTTNTITTKPIIQPIQCHGCHQSNIHLLLIDEFDLCYLCSATRFNPQYYCAPCYNQHFQHRVCLFCCEKFPKNRKISTTVSLRLEHPDAMDIPCSICNTETNVTFYNLDHFCDPCIERHGVRYICDDCFSVYHNRYSPCFLCGHVCYTNPDKIHYKTI